MKRYDFNVFLKQAIVGAEGTSSGKSFQTMGASNAKLWSSVFWTYVQMDRIEEPPRSFYLMVVSCTISSTTVGQKSTKVTGMEETCKLF